MNDFRPPKTTANNDNRKIDSIGTLKERRKRRTFTDILIAAANELPLHRQPEFIQNIVQLAKEGPEDDGEKLNKYIEENAQKYGSEENEKRWTGLHYLCNSKNVTPRAIQLYLEQCKDTITFYANFTTPLHLLCRNENVKKEHLNCYMQYETKGMTNMDEDLQTPLHYLCRATYCTVELIKSALLEYPDAGTFRGGTTVTTYVNREIEKLKSINEKNINNNSVENKVTRQASNSAMETLLSDRFYDEHSTVTGCTGLHYLCRNRIVSEKMLKEYLRYSKDAASTPSTLHKERIPLHLLASNPGVNIDLLSTYITAYPDAMVFKDADSIQPRQILWSTNEWNQMFQSHGPIFIKLMGKFRSKYDAFVRVNEHDNGSYFILT